jgi:hypothetical protein
MFFNGFDQVYSDVFRNGFGISLIVAGFADFS